MDKLATIPNLMDLVRNPFLLTLALEALPSVIQGRSDLSRLKITRAELYDRFVDHWLESNKRRLQEQSLRDNKHEALEDLLADGFVYNGIVFQKDLAAAIFQEQDGRPIVEYSNQRDKSSWKGRFFSSEPVISLLRDASLLNRTGNQYRFIHRSVLEYFLSRTVWDTATEKDEFAPHVYSEATGVSLPVAGHLLSKRSLVPEPSVIHFLIERVQMQPIFKQYLLALIELSKSDPQASIAAANAITILVRAGIHFNGADLRGIRIPGANLTAGQFDSAQLQDSDLTGVNFTKAWIRQADFTRARMEDTRFGELPYLQERTEVFSCAFSPDGMSFVAGLMNGYISIYDTTTWTRIGLLHRHKWGVRSLAYSTTGLALLTSDSRGTVRLWDSGSDSTDRVLGGRFQEVRAVAFSPSGMQFASASEDRSVRLWDTRTVTVTFIINDHSGPVTNIAYSPRGSNIASSCLDGKVRVFDTQTGLLVLSSGTSDVGYYCLGYSPNGQSIISGDSAGELQLWEATTMMPRIKWKGHSGTVKSVQFSPNGQWIVSGGCDKLVKLWDGYAATLVSVFTGHTYGINSVTFSPDGSLIASACTDRTVRLWEVNSAGFGRDPDGAFDPKTSVAYSPDGLYLVSGSRAGVMQQHDASGEISLVICRQEFQANSVAYSSDGCQIAMGGSGGEVTLWSAHTGALENTLRGHTKEVKGVAYSSCGQWIASGGDDHAVRIWSARSGTCIHVLSVPFFRSLSFSSSGAEIAVVGSFETVQVWDVRTGRSKVVNNERGSIGQCFVRYLPGGLHTASCHGKTGARLWDEKGRRSRVILQHGDIVIQSFAFSSCGQWIASVQGNTIHLWRSRPEGGLQDWEYVLAVEGCLGEIVDIDWRPNELEFATADASGSTRVWRVVKESSRVRVQLAWGSGRTARVTSGSILDNAIGLSAFNRNLLKQPIVDKGRFFPSASDDERSRSFEVKYDVKELQYLHSDDDGSDSFSISSDSSCGRSPLLVPTEPDSDFYFSDNEQ